MNLTDAQINRITSDYSAIAKEQVTIEQIGTSVYVFGSELATLRLFRSMPTITQGYSENLKTFYTAMALPI